MIETTYLRLSGNYEIPDNALPLVMVYPREILNRLKWTSGESLDDATIWYLHRGAPGDRMSVSGSRIETLDKVFFETDEAVIPYHRILKIEYRGKIVFDKKKESTKK
jgi:uncharacterized protein (UPF0248 family)